MYEFIYYALSAVKDCALRVGILIAIAAVVVIPLYRRYTAVNGDGKGFPWSKIILVIVLVGYLVALDNVTLNKGSSYNWDYNLHLFRSWRDAWNQFSLQPWLNVLLNTFMFAPLGMILPFLHHRFRKWYTLLITSFGVSLYIEITQWLFGKGLLDVDDLFCNMLGAMIGFFFIKAIIVIKDKQAGRFKIAAQNLALGLLPIACIIGIFIWYDAKEYGNLPNDATYTINTKDTQWNLQCTLPETNTSMPVYRTDRRTFEECDSFAEQFKKIIGTDDYHTISYYQDAAYYIDHSGDENGAHMLQVSYKDLGFDYSVMGEIPLPGELDQAQLETLLSEFPVFVPEYSQFLDEGNGWYSFRVDKHVTQTEMIDGILRCRYSNDGMICAIEDHLQIYSFYRIADVITVQQAMESLYAGKWRFPNDEECSLSGTISIYECSLEYEVDTKGFYRPVYYFDIVTEEGNHIKDIMISALAY